MVKIRIIPVLLLRGNSIVKSVCFSEHRMIGDAITAVKVFSNRKADELIILDIDAYKNGINYELLARLAKSAFMPLTIGGGIKCVEDAEKFFLYGADKVSVNSLFLQKPQEVTKIVDKFGSQAVCLSLDFKEIEGRYSPYFDNGKTKASLNLQECMSLAKEIKVGEILVNSIERDGVMKGFDIKLISEVSSLVDFPVIACGGCNELNDFSKAVVAGADAVAAGSIFHWKGESVISIKEDMLRRGHNIREI